MLVVVEADAVVDPRAVVVHLEDAAVCVHVCVVCEWIASVLVSLGSCEPQYT